MSTIDLVRKLLSENADPNQLWVVMTYFVSKDLESDPIGYFVFLKAFPNRDLASEYAQSLIERTGMQTIIAVPACKLLPISKESMGKVVPVNITKEGKLICFSKERDKEEAKKKEEKQRIDDMFETDKKHLNDPNSVASIARYWYLYTKYDKLKKLHQEKVDFADKMIRENTDRINPHLDKTQDIIEYLNDRLTTVKENDLLELMLKRISSHTEECNQKNVKNGKETS